MQDFNSKIKDLDNKISQEINRDKNIEKNKQKNIYNNNILYELIAAFIVGSVIGWQIDYLFVAKPYGLISCILLSFFSYIFKLYKS